MDLFQLLSNVDVLLYLLAFAVPLMLLFLGKVAPKLSESTAFGQALSVLIALGLVGLVFELLLCIYLTKKGTDLMTDVPLMALFSPLVFGFGTLWTGTRIISFAELRRFPVLRRVWAMLTLSAVVLVAWLVLKQTYWLVFSGIVGFLIVALVGWTLIRKLAARVTDPAPPGGDPNLVDEVISDSKAEAARLAEQIARDSNAGSE